MHELPRLILIPLPTVLGIDLSITNEVLLLWIAAFITGALLICVFRRQAPVASGPFQNFFESLVEFINESVVKDSIGPEGKRWAPLLLTFFFFILFINLLGMLPLPSHVKAMTSDISVTGALALIVFALTIAISIRAHGVLGFLKKFIPTGIPAWIMVLVVPIEIISWLARPLSLAIRLFANMLAGHALILVFVSLAAGGAWFIKPVPLAGAVAMSLFELFICFVQAFVFTLLAGMYIKDALESH
ncbi:MAG: F0F1 ATP synthase subunit A [Kiritimatiellae bacterium]|nr:F0F1 ATP synthase subunit A [Kiritimatiellia bacterium]